MYKLREYRQMAENAMGNYRSTAKTEERRHWLQIATNWQFLADERVEFLREVTATLGENEAEPVRESTR